MVEAESGEFHISFCHLISSQNLTLLLFLITISLQKPWTFSFPLFFYDSVFASFASFHVIGVYSETTWAVGIAQLTHHEVQGGGKNPETGGRGIFAPTANRVVS